VRISASGAPPVNGPWPCIAFQITRTANTSSESATPPIPNRKAAHSSSGSGRYKRALISSVPICGSPNTSSPTMSTEAKSNNASAWRRPGSRRTQVAAWVANVITTGTQMTLVSTLDRKRVRQMSPKSLLTPVSTTTPASRNDTSSGAAIAAARNTSTFANPSSGRARLSENLRTAQAPSAPSPRLVANQRAIVGSGVACSICTTRWAGATASA